MQNLKCFTSRSPVIRFRETPGFLNSTVYNKVLLRTAGHSKWANIRHIKAIKDLERSKHIIKFHQRMQVAIKEFGSPDPKKNIRLASVIEDAKDAKMPMASISKILDTIAKAKKESRKEIWGLKGPGRCLLLVEVFTDNHQKGRQDLNWYLKKGGGHSSQWIETDISNMFTCTGIILCSHYSAKPVQEELLEDSIAHAIDAGADDVTFEDNVEYGNVFEFTTGTSNFYKVKSFLTSRGYTIVHTDIIYTPQARVELNETDMAATQTLINKLMESDLVVNIYDNIA